MARKQCLSTDEQAFHQMILRNPDDEVPRLICADWLEERGDPRGEFIRVQCALEGSVRRDLGRPALLARQAALLQQHGDEWRRPFARLVEVAEFRRGFVEVVRLTARAFIRSAARLFRLAPIRRVELTKLAGVVSELADCPELANVVELDVSGNELGSRGLRPLFASPHLTGLRRLELSNCGIDPFGVRFLAEAPMLAGLHTLDLARNGLGAPGAEALAASPNLSGLRELNLHGNGIAVAGIRALAASNRLGPLVTLRLGDNYLGEGTIALTAWPGLHRLTTLDLSGNLLHNAEAEALASSRFLRELQALDIGVNRIGDRGAELLAGSRGVFDSLVSLRLTRNEIGDRGALALAHATGLAALRELDLAENRIGESGGQALATSASLTRLVLDGGRLTTATRRELRERYGDGLTLRGVTSDV